MENLVRGVHWYRLLAFTKNPQLEAAVIYKFLNKCSYRYYAEINHCEVLKEVTWLEPSNQNF